MELTGDYLIAAPRAVVWQALNEPELLRDCVPGCGEVARVSPTRFEGQVSAQIGPLKMRFGGRVELEDMDPPYGHTLVLEAGGGGAGIVKARAHIRMADVDGMTRLTYVAQLTTDGAIGQLAPALLQAEVSALAQNFFIRLGHALAALRVKDAADGRFAGPQATASPRLVVVDPVLVDAALADSVLVGTTLAAMAGKSAVPEDESLPAATSPGYDGPALAPTVWIPALVGLVGLLLFVATR
ncbi:MAG TPA: carbon monoxide dehydrogenase subunit G [Stellaceae bacterium]|nr:carbon monoxide dehydrogenase subunit G [Stellaceae bacterium]